MEEDKYKNLCYEAIMYIEDMEECGTIFTATEIHDIDLTFTARWWNENWMHAEIDENDRKKLEECQEKGLLEVSFRKKENPPPVRV